MIKALVVTPLLLRKCFARMRHSFSIFVLPPTSLLYMHKGVTVQRVRPPVNLPALISSQLQLLFQRQSKSTNQILRNDQDCQRALIQPKLAHMVNLASPPPVLNFAFVSIRMPLSDRECETNVLVVVMVQHPRICRSRMALEGREPENGMAKDSKRLPACVFPING